MASKQCPPLPNELWTQILGNLYHLEDLMTLWKSCRQVNVAFKENIESMFIERQLPVAQVSFHLGEFLRSGPNSHEDDGSYDCLLDTMGFHCLGVSEDGVNAIFQMDTEDLPSDRHSRAGKQLREYLESMDITAPKHMVRIRREVNDSPIPDMVVDYEKLQFTCNWRELLGAFYTEEYLYDKLVLHAMFQKLKKYLDERARESRGEHHPIANSISRSKCDNDLSLISQDSRKLARRARIRWQFKQKDGTEWDFSRDGDKVAERKWLAKLRKVRYYYKSYELFDDDICERRGWYDEDDDICERRGWYYEDEDEDEWEDASSDSDSDD